MFVVPSTLQVVLAIVLVLLGLCGNLVVPFVSYRTTLRGPHITVLAALDFTATLLGPGLTLVILVIGPTWLENNKPLCLSLSFLSSSLLITCVLVLFVLAAFCQQVQHNIHPGRRRRARRKQCVFLAVCLFSGLLMCVSPLLGWSSYNGLSFMQSCSPTKHLHSTSNYSLFYLVCFAVALLVTIVLVFRARKHRRLYPIQIFSERHDLEARINDPELTTAASSNTSCSGSRHRTRSNLSRIRSECQSRNQSRRSSARSRASTVMSLNPSPVMPRKYSQQARALENSLLEIILRSKCTDNGTAEDTKETHSEKSPSPACSDTKDSQSSSPSTHLQVVPPTATNPRDAFVISSRISHSFHAQLNVRKIFHNPRFLPQFTAHQQQRSLIRLLSLRCCVTLMCWLPFYCTVALRLSSVHYPQQLLMLIQWLIFIQSSISSLLPLCDASYRRALRRAARSVFKACARRNKGHANLGESRDVEFKIEGTKQVQLRDIILHDIM